MMDAPSVNVLIQRETW